MNQSFVIRKANPEDARPIHEAHMKSIQELCSKDHTPEEIQAWGYRAFNEEQRVFAIKNHLVYVVTFNNQVQGYGHLKISSPSAHLMGLYLTSVATGHGVGNRLLSILTDEAKNHNAVEMGLESTLTSRTFYLKNGFVEKGGIETIMINNQPIRCIPMIKKF